MAQVTRLGLYGGPRPPQTFTGAPASATISGTITSAATEADVVAGGETIIITLTNDTWVSAGASFDAQRQNIIDGLDSAGAELLGWNNEVRDKEVVGAVVRTSDTVVTITLTAAVAYDITADETITVTVPATALVTSASDVTGSPIFDVAFVPAAAGTPEGAGGVGGFPRREEHGRRRQRLKQRDDTRGTQAPVPIYDTAADAPEMVQAAVEEVDQHMRALEERMETLRALPDVDHLEQRLEEIEDSLEALKARRALLLLALLTAEIF